MRKILSESFLQNIRIEKDEYPPYERIGMGESIGFEVWLQKN